MRDFRGKKICQHNEFGDIHLCISFGKSLVPSIYDSSLEDNKTDLYSAPDIMQAFNVCM